MKLKVTIWMDASLINEFSDLEKLKKDFKSEIEDGLGNDWSIEIKDVEVEEVEFDSGEIK